MCGSRQANSTCARNCVRALADLGEPCWRRMRDTRQRCSTQAAPNHLEIDVISRGLERDRGHLRDSEQTCGLIICWHGQRKVACGYRLTSKRINRHSPIRLSRIVEQHGIEGGR